MPTEEEKTPSKNMQASAKVARAKPAKAEKGDTVRISHAAKKRISEEELALLYQLREVYEREKLNISASDLQETRSGRLLKKLLRTMYEEEHLDKISQQREERNAEPKDTALLALEVTRLRQSVLDLKDRVTKLEDSERNINILDAAITHVRQQQQLDQHNIYCFLSSISTDPLLAETNINRYLPIRVYLDESSQDSEDRIRVAIQAIFEAVGLSIACEFPTEFGSYWKTFFSKTKEVATIPEVEKRLEKIERAFELKALDQPQATVNREQAEAVKALFEAIKDTPNAAVQVGSLLIIKVTDNENGAKVLTLSMTHEQMALINSNPKLLTQPNKILDLLSEDNRGVIAGRKPKELSAPALEAECARGDDKNDEHSN